MCTAGHSARHSESLTAALALGTGIGQSRTIHLGIPSWCCLQQLKPLWKLLMMKHSRL